MLHELRAYRYAGDEGYALRPDRDGPFGITLNTIGVGSIETNQIYDWMQKRADESGATYDEVIEGRASPTAKPYCAMAAK